MTARTPSIEIMAYQPMIGQIITNDLLLRDQYGEVLSQGVIIEEKPPEFTISSLGWISIISPYAIKQHELSTNDNPTTVLYISISDANYNRTVIQFRINQTQLSRSILRYLSSHVPHMVWNAVNRLMCNDHVCDTTCTYECGYKKSINMVSMYPVYMWSIMILKRTQLLPEIQKMIMDKVISVK